MTPEPNTTAEPTAVCPSCMADFIAQGKGVAGELCPQCSLRPRNNAAQPAAPEHVCAEWDAGGFCVTCGLCSQCGGNLRPQADAALCVKRGYHIWNGFRKCVDCDKSYHPDSVDNSGDPPPAAARQGATPFADGKLSRVNEARERIAQGKRVFRSDIVSDLCDDVERWQARFAQAASLIPHCGLGQGVAATPSAPTLNNGQLQTLAFEVTRHVNATNFEGAVAVLRKALSPSAPSEAPPPTVPATSEVRFSRAVADLLGFLKVTPLRLGEDDAETYAMLISVVQAASSATEPKGEGNA